MTLESLAHPSPQIQPYFLISKNDNRAELLTHPCPELHVEQLNKYYRDRHCKKLQVWPFGHLEDLHKKILSQSTLKHTSMTSVVLSGRCYPG